VKSRRIVFAIVVALLGGAFVAALFVLCRYWPEDDNNQKLKAIFLLLQLAASLGLLFLTGWYAEAAWALIESQNREPEICIPDHPMMPVAPGSVGAEFSIEFRVLVSNPGIRAASVMIERVDINGITARSAMFWHRDNSTSRDITVAGGGVAEVKVSAAFTDLTAFPARRCVLLVKDLFRQRTLTQEVNW
jgi:hypothetical protein